MLDFGVVADLVGERHYPVSYTAELTSAVVVCLDTCIAAWRSQTKFSESLSVSARNSCLAAANMVFNWFPPVGSPAPPLPPGEILGRSMLLIVSVGRTAGINPDDAATIVKYLVGTISKITAVASPQRDVGPYHDAVYGALRAICCFSFDIDSELYSWISHRLVPIHVASLPAQSMGVAMVLERSAALRLLTHFHSQWLGGRVLWEVVADVGSKLFFIAGELQQCGTDPESLTGAYELWKAISAEQQAIEAAANTSPSYPIDVSGESVTNGSFGAVPPPPDTPRSKGPGVSAAELMHFLKEIEGKYQNELGCMAVTLNEEALVTAALQKEFDKERDTSDALYRKLCETLGDKENGGVSVGELATLALHGAVSAVAARGQ